MQGRAPTSLVVVLLLTGLALADGRARLGTPTTDDETVADAAGRLESQTVGLQTAGVQTVGLQTVETQTTGTQNIGTQNIGTQTIPLPLDPPAPASRVWVDAEALLWWMKAANLPPLVTASPPGTPRDAIGVMVRPGTTILFGGSPVNGDLKHGGRITGGFWVNDNRTVGIEGYFFELAGQAQHFSGGSPGNLGRPFLNTETGRPDARADRAPRLC